MAGYTLKFEVAGTRHPLAVNPDELIRNTLNRVPGCKVGLDKVLFIGNLLDQSKSWRSAGVPSGAWCWLQRPAPEVSVSGAVRLAAPTSTPAKRLRGPSCSPAPLAAADPLTTAGGAGILARIASTGKVVSFVGTKGGVGKSTTLKQISAVAAQSRPNAKICIIDTDAQGHQGLRAVGPEQQGGGFSDVFAEAMKPRANQSEIERLLEIALKPTAQGNAFVLYAPTEQMIEISTKVQANPFVAQTAFNRILALLKRKFNYVFIDTAGNPTDNLLQLSLGGADLAVIISAAGSDYVAKETITTADKCRVAKESGNPALKVGVVLNKVSGRAMTDTLTKQAEGMVKDVGDATGDTAHNLGALRTSETALKATEGKEPLTLMRSLPAGGEHVLPELKAITQSIMQLIDA